MSSAEPLCIVKRGPRYGFQAEGRTVWLPPAMWANAEAMLRQINAMNSTMAQFQKLADAAQAEADAAGGVQTAYHG
jgi:hypothetical protein